MTTTSDKVIPADWVPGPKQGQWTYEDYAKLPEDGKRYEIVDGVLYMAPAPDLPHQEIAGEIFAHLRIHVKLAGLGRVFMAPVDVELAPHAVFQPDVVVLLNASLAKMRRKRIKGAPDLVVEIASPSTSDRDRSEKYDIYASAGVSEYWIVNPEARTVEIFALETGKYRRLGTFRGNDTLPSRVAPDLPVQVEQLFAWVE